MRLLAAVFAALPLLLLQASVMAGDLEKQPDPPSVLDDGWRFTLAVPGWMPAFEGDVGINGLVSRVELDPGDLIRHYDFALSMRAEASKGRFGFMGDVLYTTLSDGVGTETIIKKLDIQVDQTIAELALRWRLVEGPRGFIDVIGGVRYVNVFQQVVTQPNDARIEEAVEAFGDQFSERVRQRVDDVLSERRLRDALANAARERLLDAAGRFTGPNPPEQNLPNGPLLGPHFGRLGRVIDRIVRERAEEAISAAAEEARAAAQARLDALRARTAAARAEAQRRVEVARANLNRRIAEARADVEEEVEKTLHDALDTRAARTDDWWDPFIGLRARYYFNDRLYVAAKGDIGGFGVGSDLAWSAEGSIGFQLTERIFAEAGYRALRMDYDDDGLTYDVLMHGAQVTMGITF